VSPAEKLFFPVYLFLMAVAWLSFLLRMLPGMAAAFLLGRYNALALLPKWVLEGRWQGRPGYRRFYRFYGWRWTLAALVWNALALALSVFLGRWIGWWVTYSPKGQGLGTLLTAGCFLLGRVFPPDLKKNQEA
jgi:hypothetical protein